MPPSLTWLLQPLDTHCFARYKAELDKIAADSFRDLHRDPAAEDIAIVVGTVTRKVLQGTVWRKPSRKLAGRTNSASSQIK